MKKFLSIIISVAMLFSLVVAFGAPTAKAASPTTVTLSDTSNYMYLTYFNPTAGFGTSGTPVTTGNEVYVYKMGDVIHGTLDQTPISPWKVELINMTGTTVVDSVNVAAGSASFTIGTGNVSLDGEYMLRVSSLAGTPEFRTFTSNPFYIQYNLTWGANTIANCGGTQTISGWITRGNGQTVLVPVNVYVTYPDKTLAGYYTVAALSSGQFTITFPTSSSQIGNFYVYLSDGYDTANTDNDAMVYDTLSNVPATSITLSTYVSPVLLYQGVSSQPILLYLTDQNGNYVTGATITAVDTEGTDVLSSPAEEVSPGFYRVVINATDQPDVRFQASYNPYSAGEIDSNTVIISLRALGVFNPYIDVDAPMSIPTYGSGPRTVGSPLARDVYDKLPCTIGNSLYISVGYYPPADPANWYIPSLGGTNPSISVDGPLLSLGGNVYLIQKAGKITASIDMIAWQRANTTCAPWTEQQKPTDEELTAMSENACCHEYSKTFNVCEVNSCIFGGVTLSNGAQVDATTIQVGDKAQFAVSVDPTGAPADLMCSCPNYVVHAYMTDSSGNILTGAFTVDTWGGTPVTLDQIWYNPMAIPGTGIADLPITFGSTAQDIKFGDCPFTLQGVVFNYPNTTDCGYNLVVQVFGVARNYDACGDLSTTYPLIAEVVNPIDIIPATTTLSSNYTLTEGAVDPDQILAGVPVTIDITDPGFTLGTPNWVFTLNGNALDTTAPTVSTTDTGYRFNITCPLDAAGTFEIYGYVYDTANDCTSMEEVTVDIPVILPEFTVKIGLLDGSVIDNDHIITEGFPELIYVTPTDPRGIHDFTTDSTWTLEASALSNDCGLPTSVICYTVPEGCTVPSPIQVGGYHNPNISDPAQFGLYFVTGSGCSYIPVDTFTLVAPTVAVDPTEVPFTIPATATHVSFTVTDAHGHGAPGVDVQVSNGIVNASNSSGYTWLADGGVTGTNGEADWAFVPPFSGKYSVGASFEGLCTLPCNWPGINASATFEAKYQAPVIDTEAPVVTVTAPAAGAALTTSPVKVMGTVTDNVGVTMLYIGSQKVDFAPDGTFSAMVDLTEGANTIKVFAFDAAGNKGETDVAVTYAPPKVTVVKVQIGSDIMTVNGNVVQLDAAPEIVNGRTFLPLRAISEALGATVDWIPDTQGITVTLGDSTVGLQIGNTSAVVNGTVMTLDAAPYIKNSRTMVPLRVIAEGLGAAVTWDPALRVVTITLSQ
jgi:hypothetical protein